MPRADPMASGGDHSGFGRRVLPLQAVTDAYTYFSCPGSVYVSIQTFNNGVDIGFGSGGTGQLGSAVYPPVDEYLALSNAQYPRNCDEIRFKNHVAGQAAQIQITAQGLADLPSGTPLGVSIEPNFLTVNSDGTVGAVFPGGVQLIEGVGSGYVPNASIGWVDSITKVVREFIKGRKAGTDHILVVESSPDATDSAIITLKATEAGVAGSSVIQAFLTDNSGANVNPIFVDSLGRSAFPQLEGVLASTKISWGVFTTGTGVINNAGSGDWSLSGLAAGQATVNFAARTSNPAVLATVLTAGAINAYAEDVLLGPNSCLIATLNGATAPPVLVNAIVSFLVIG